MQPASLPDPEWIIDADPVDYPQALAWMEERAAAVADGEAREAVRFLEHPPLYTAGTSADPSELRDPHFPVFVAGRGGRYTYHGPGQCVVYSVIDLNSRGRDVRGFVHALEGWMIRVLARLGVAARRAPGRIGIWANDPQLGEAKIGAIGVRVRRWVTLHGFAINVDPNLADFAGIVPCGIAEFGVTSVARMGGEATRAACERAVQVELVSFLDDLKLKQSA
ncbi:MAG: lipoyl(octanoyl) transferase LipB [Sphingomonadaceae bacterium]